MSSLSASPKVAAKATPLPRLYINHLPELDWLIAVEFGAPMTASRIIAKQDSATSCSTRKACPWH